MRNQLHIRLHNLPVLHQVNIYFLDNIGKLLENREKNKTCIKSKEIACQLPKLSRNKKYKPIISVQFSICRYISVIYGRFGWNIIW